jgi:DNA-binding NarL/FixJ family response regulator
MTCTRLGVDPVAAMRAVDGDKVRLSPADRRLVVAELTGRGWSAKRIAPHVNLTTRSVIRIRARLREQQAT